jgi:hypothetical protein
MQELTESSSPYAESLAEHADYWSGLGTLTPAQRRWSAFELELREELAAKGEKPAEWLIAEIRTGQWERCQRRSMRNMLRSQAKLAMWRREGYTFDAEHRLLAPVASSFTERRGTSREQRPQSRPARRSGAASSRGDPSRDDPDRPLAHWRPEQGPTAVAQAFTRALAGAQ